LTISGVQVTQRICAEGVSPYNVEYINMLIAHPLMFAPLIGYSEPTRNSLQVF